MPRGDPKKLARAILTRGLDIRSSVVAGAAANTNIPVTGIKRSDVLLTVLEFIGPAEAGGGAITDRTSVTSVTSDGNVQATVITNTSVDRRLLILWAKV